MGQQRRERQEREKERTTKDRATRNLELLKRVGAAYSSLDSPLSFLKWFHTRTNEQRPKSQPSSSSESRKGIRGTTRERGRDARQTPLGSL